MTTIVPVQNLNLKLIKNTFETLSYGPAPESDKVAKVKNCFISKYLIKQKKYNKTTQSNKNTDQIDKYLCCI